MATSPKNPPTTASRESAGTTNALKENPWLFRPPADVKKLRLMAEVKKLRPPADVKKGRPPAEVKKLRLMAEVKKGPRADGEGVI